MNDSVLAASFAASGHSGAGGAVMAVVLGLAALAGYGVYHWRKQRDHGRDDGTAGRS